MTDWIEQLATAKTEEVIEQFFNQLEPADGIKSVLRSAIAQALEKAAPRIAELERELYGTADNAVWGKQKWIENAEYWKKSYDQAIVWRDDAVAHNKVLQTELAELRSLADPAKK